MKLLLENWRKYLNENQDIWYHGGKIKDNLRSLYLTPSESLASMHGDLNSFKIADDAQWLDLSNPPLEHLHSSPISMISMDSLGYDEEQIDRVSNAGYDIAWDQEDYRRGYEQIFVVNPGVLIMLGDKE